MPAVDEQVQEIIDDDLDSATEEAATEVVVSEEVVADGVTVEDASGPTFIDRVSGLGFDGIENEQDASNRIIDSYQQLQSQIEQLQEQNQSYSQLAGYGNEYLNLMRDGKLPQEKEQPKEEVNGSWWEPPSYDHSLADRYRESIVDPESGEQSTKWSDGTPADVRSSYDAHQQYIDKWADDLVHRPQEVLPRIIDQEVNRILDERLSERDEVYAAERFAEQVQTENSSWLFENDPRTNTVRVDPVTRQPILTDDGQRVMAYSDAAAEMGITDPRAQWEYATAMHHRDVLSSQFDGQGTATSTAQKAVDKKMEHLKRAATGGRGRGGTQSAAEDTETSQNVHLSAKMKLRDQMRQDGLIS